MAVTVQTSAKVVGIMRQNARLLAFETSLFGAWIKRNTEERYGKIRLYMKQEEPEMEWVERLNQSIVWIPVVKG